MRAIACAVPVVAAALALGAVDAGCSRRKTGGDAVRGPMAAPVSEDPNGPRAGASDAAFGGDLVTDPFCGMRLAPAEAAATAEYDGVTYYFCLEDHKEAFLADPERILHPPADRTGGGDGGRPPGRH